ncbi:SURF1 family protein [soil metagenome]
MYRFLLSPKWLGFHLLVVGAVVLMVNLGFWQLRRLDEKHERNARIEQRIDEAPVALSELLPVELDATDAPPADAEWRPITATGVYELGETVSVLNRSQDGAAGDMVVTPLRLDDGRLLLVERGFVPLAADAADAPSGEVTVTGRLRASQQHQPGQLSDPADGVLDAVLRFDIPRLAEQLDGPVVPMYIELTASTPAEATPYPAPVTPPELTNGPHPSYAVQWFVFSICVAVGWVLAVRRSVGTRRATAHT